MEPKKAQSGPIDGFALWLAGVLDGNKTIAGLILIAGGIATVFATPDYREEGVMIVLSGISMLVTGVTHKQIKSEKQDA